MAITLFCIKKGGISAFLAPVSGESDAAHIFSHGEKFGDSEPKKPRKSTFHFAWKEVIPIAVFRIAKAKDYTVMSNHHLRNNELSLKAKGLLSLMLSLPEDWDYTLKGLSKICKDGFDSIRAGVQEPEAQGYLVRQRVRLPNGRLGSVEYTILEQPKPKPEIPTLEKPMLDIPTQLNKDILNANLSNTYESNPTLLAAQQANR